MTKEICTYLEIGYGEEAPDGFQRDFYSSKISATSYIDRGIRYADHSIDAIYCQNFLSNLSLAYICKFLRECRRVLKPDGIIRIITTDLKNIITSIQSDKWRTFTTPNNKWITNGAEYLNVLTQEDKTWLCDATELTRLLSLCGIENSHQKTSVTSEILQLSEYNEDSESLIIEGKKPNRHPKNNALVTITIPAYRPEFIASCLDSVVSQTYQFIEVIIVDDSPNEEVEKIVQQYMNRDSRISYERNPKPLGEARNLTRAINLAKGDFIKPVYDDDTITAECVQKLIDAYHQYPDIRLAVGRRIPIDENGTQLDPAILGPALAQHSREICGHEAISAIINSGINLIGEPTVMLFRRDDVLALNEPDVMSLFGRRCYGIGDIGLALQLLSRGNLAYVADTIGHFRIHSGQNQRRPDFKKWVEGSWNYVRKHAARIGLDQAALPKEPDTLADKKNNLQIYSRWQSKRTIISEEIKIIQDDILSTPPTFFHLCIRLELGSESYLADTIDSLSVQLYQNWHLDVITELSPPEGIEEIPCISWNIAQPLEQKSKIDSLVDSRNLDWCIEIPAGVRLDPLYLWRIAKELRLTKKFCCYFVDDDCFDSTKNSFNPRFKPGCNPSALLTSDLAGPICIAKETWNKIGGAATEKNSPWFDQLLRIAYLYGWDQVSHIPDVLLSYPEKFPTDDATCQKSLLKHLNDKGNKHAEIIQLGSHGWHVRYPLATEITVTIGIISDGNFDFVCRCLNSIINATKYENYEIALSLPDDRIDPDLTLFIAEKQKYTNIIIRTITPKHKTSYAAQCNAVAISSKADLILFISDETQIIQETWLGELVRTALQPSVTGVSPRLLQPGSAMIESAGNIIGLSNRIAAPLYQSNGKYGDPGYLLSIQNARDLSTLSKPCFLVRKDCYLAVGGIDETELNDYLSEIDLSLKLRKAGGRLVYEPLSNVVYQLSAENGPPKNPEEKALIQLSEMRAEKTFKQRWWPEAAVDPFWNPNLSLTEATPTPEIDFRATWQTIPSNLPRILARPVTNPQGIFRITSPLRALRRAGMAAECVWPQDTWRGFMPAELIRLAADSFVLQNYLNDHRLTELAQCHASPGRPFMIYTIDDLMSNLAKNNPHRITIQANPKERIKYALARCDRLVVSTEYLAETYQHLISDIRVVPNRLEQASWLPLQSHKRTANKPRIGWAGGTSHQDDLLLLKEIIERTRHKADWIFMGMCPNEIRPLIAEFHPLVSFDNYPAHLASLHLDIAVAPLAEIPFNRAKSNLRLLEYGMLGIPVVCTDIEPYRFSPACCVANTPEAWISALNERIHDADAREREGQDIRHWVKQHYLLENHLEEWLRAHLPD